MKVKMKALSAGPEGVRKPGQVCEVSETEGKALIAGKYAESVAVKPVAPVKAPATKAEDSREDIPARAEKEKALKAEQPVVKKHKADK